MASRPMTMSRFKTLRATRSAGQPTKLSTTYCSPVDEEMALRDVPKSIPTLTISPPVCFSAAMRLHPFRCVRSRFTDKALNPGNERLGYRLSVFRCLQPLRIRRIRQARDLSENRRHLSGNQDHERRHLDSAIDHSRLDAPQRAYERALNRHGEPFRFVPFRIRIDPLEQHPHIRQRVTGVLVFGRRNRIGLGATARTEVVGLNPARTPRLKRIQVNREKD